MTNLLSNPSVKTKNDVYLKSVLELTSSKAYLRQPGIFVLNLLNIRHS